MTQQHRALYRIRLFGRTLPGMMLRSALLLGVAAGALAAFCAMVFGTLYPEPYLELPELILGGMLFMGIFGFLLGLLMGLLSYVARVPLLISLGATLTGGLTLGLLVLVLILTVSNELGEACGFGVLASLVGALAGGLLWTGVWEARQLLQREQEAAAETVRPQPTAPQTGTPPAAGPQ